MARPLSSLRAGVEDWLASKGDTAPHYEGPENILRHHAPPRYVWIPTSDETGPEVMKQTNPRTIYGFREGFQVHCWGTDYDDAYRLRNNLIVAFRLCVGADGRIESSMWLHQEATSPNDVLGRVYILNMSILVPVVEAYDGTSIATTTEIEAVEHDCLVLPQNGFDEGFSTGFAT